MMAETLDCDNDITPNETSEQNKKQLWEHKENCSYISAGKSNATIQDNNSTKTPISSPTSKTTNATISPTNEKSKSIAPTPETTGDMSQDNFLLDSITEQAVCGKLFLHGGFMDPSMTMYDKDERKTLGNFDKQLSSYSVEKGEF